MKMARFHRSPRRALLLEVAALRVRLTEANDTLRAIHRGEVDTVVVAGKQGPQVFSLDGVEHVYRVLIESMNEGALTLSSKKVIFYANRCFSKMVRCSLEKVIGGSLDRFLSEEDRTTLRPLLKPSNRSGSKVRVMLIAKTGIKTPVQISIRHLARNELGGATISMVVTDLTEARKSEEMLRALTQRIVQVQEDERGRVAFELHDNITQLLCGVLFRSQALADKLTHRDGSSKKEATVLREMLGKTAEEVERISHNLGPHVLDHLGLCTALGEISTEFTGRTGVVVKLTCVQLAVRLPQKTELALYRILQEALRNVEKHASARHVTVRLSQKGAHVRFQINDDGVGFDPANSADGQKRGLGLLSMRERASYVGGALKIDSDCHAGTTIEVLLPAAKTDSRTTVSRHAIYAGLARPLIRRISRPAPSSR